MRRYEESSSVVASGVANSEYVGTLLNDLRQSPVGFLQALYSAAIAAGIHLYPFRTEQLSPPSPMVLTHQLEE